MKHFSPDCPANQTVLIFDTLRQHGELREVMLGNACLTLFRLADYRKVYEALLRKVNCKIRKVCPRVCSVTVKSDWDSVH